MGLLCYCARGCCGLGVPALPCAAAPALRPTPSLPLPLLHESLSPSYMPSTCHSTKSIDAPTAHRSLSLPSASASASYIPSPALLPRTTSPHAVSFYYIRIPNNPPKSLNPQNYQDEIPVMSIDAETARQTLASVDDIYSTPTRPAQAAVPAMQQVRGLAGEAGTVAVAACSWQLAIGSARRWWRCQCCSRWEVGMGGWVGWFGFDGDLHLLHGRRTAAAWASCTSVWNAACYSRPLPHPPLPPHPPIYPGVQEDCHNASSLHVWSASYCDSESARNSMESTDMYLSD